MTKISPAFQAAVAEATRLGAMTATYAAGSGYLTYIKGSIRGLSIAGELRGPICSSKPKAVRAAIAAAQRLVASSPRDLSHALRTFGFANSGSGKYVRNQGERTVTVQLRDAGLHSVAIAVRGSSTLTPIEFKSVQGMHEAILQLNKLVTVSGR